MNTYYSSENKLKPISVEYEHDSYINMKCEEFNTTDSYTFIQSPVLDGVKDIVNNKSTKMYLTSSLNMGSILEDNSTEVPFPSSISSPSGVYIADGFNPDRGNDWVVYYNDIATPALNRQTTIDHSRSLSGLSQNYLLTTPYKTKIENDKIKINFHGLKNMQNIKSEYSYTPIFSSSGSNLDIENTDNLKFREYEKIFSGTKQDGGYENIYFGYTTEFAKPIDFEPDKTTYFHYPYTAAQIPLSSIGIEYIGSAYGTSPIRSDRIYKKMANYKKNIWWGDSLQWQTGVWLCSWLSGNPTGNNPPVWMDRWYYPGFAKVSTYSLLTDDFSVTFDAATGSPVYDEPSQMTFDPGVWYKYVHMGNNTNSFIVSSLAGEGKVDLKLHYDEWDDKDIVDKSIFSNNGTVLPSFDVETDRIPLNVDINSKKYAIRLNGINEIYTPYSNTFGVTGDLSVSLWVETESWETAKSAPFISNYYRGGWELGYTNNFDDKIFYVVDSNFGHILPFSIDANSLGDYVLPYTGATTATPGALAVDSKHYLYVIDETKNSLLKFDYNGNILNEYDFGSDVLVDHIEIIPYDDMELVCVATTSNICSGLETTCLNPVTSFSGAGSISTFSFDVCSTPNYITDTGAIKLLVDNNNVVWKLTLDDLIRDSSVVYSHTNSITDIKCDKDNNIWAITRSGLLWKFNEDGVLQQESEIGDGSVLSEWSIQLAFEWIGDSNNICDKIPGTTPNTYETILYLIEHETNQIYKVSKTGQLAKIIYLSNYINIQKYSDDIGSMVFSANGDFSGYDYHRKYFYLKNNKQPQIYLKYDYYNTEWNVPKTNVLYYNVTDFPNPWHNVAFSFDSNKSEASLYVDGDRKTYTTHMSGVDIFSRFNSPIIIGKSSGKLDSLDSEIDIYDKGFDGKIGDIRVYHNVLNESDLKHIYLESFNFTTLSWVMPTNKQNIIEEVERFFRHKLPGMKSHYFNLNIYGLNITDEDTKTLVEDIIRKTVLKITPAHTELYKIVWKNNE